MQNPWLVGQVVGGARHGRSQKACQGDVGLVSAPTVDERIRNEGGQPPGSSHTTMPLSVEVYAASPINLCMQGYQRNSPRESSGICQGPPALGGGD